MMILRYSKDWADLVVAQLATRHQTRQVGDWGYACLAIGREFESVIDRNWHHADAILGPCLHVFSLVPPPRDFLLQRLEELRRLPASDDRRFATQKFEEMLRITDWERTAANKEKALLFDDLRQAGMRPDQYADFLFFDFENRYDLKQSHPEVDIHVIAAKWAGIPNDADDREYLRCLEQMAKVAERHYPQRSPANRVVRDMTLLWTIEITIDKTRRVADFLMGFIHALAGT